MASLNPRHHHVHKPEIHKFKASHEQSIKGPHVQKLKEIRNKKKEEEEKHASNERRRKSGKSPWFASARAPCPKQKIEESEEPRPCLAQPPPPSITTTVGITQSSPAPHLSSPPQAHSKQASHLCNKNRRDEGEKRIRPDFSRRRLLHRSTSPTKGCSTSSAVDPSRRASLTMSKPSSAIQSNQLNPQSAPAPQISPRRESSSHRRRSVLEPTKPRP